MNNTCGTCEGSGHTYNVDGRAIGSCGTCGGSGLYTPAGLTCLHDQRRDRCWRCAYLAAKNARCREDEGLTIATKLRRDVHLRAFGQFVA